ncbi:class I SAM-dependent methyltransferase [Candidatus Uhrbacteria bacterium]|nr:class I SAM-dependent methyltransferase [Candidatus Uhrbacteria bacterium]
MIFLHPQTTSHTYEEHYDDHYISHTEAPIKSPSFSPRAQWLMQIRRRIWQEVFCLPAGLPAAGIFSRWIHNLLRYTKLFRATPLKYPGEGKELLDVGSGAGTFLLIQRHLGWHVHGLEPAPQMVQQSRVLGLDVQQGFSIEEHWSEPTFDAVVLNQVFEHLDNLHTLLVHVRQALKKDGILYMNMPNVWSLAAQIFRSYWFNLDAPRHNLLFSPRVLRTLLEQEGYEVLDLSTVSSTKGWSGSIEYWVRDAWHIPLSTGAIRNNWPVNRLLLPLVRLCDLVGLGDNLHVIAKKTNAMKYTSCLICQNPTSETLLINKQDPFGKNVGTTETRYVICTECGFVYQNPTLVAHEIEALYSHDYYDKEDQAVSDGYKRKKKNTPTIRLTGLRSTCLYILLAQASWTSAVTREPFFPGSKPRVGSVTGWRRQKT